MDRDTLYQAAIFLSLVAVIAVVTGHRQSALLVIAIVGFLIGKALS